MKSEVKKAVEYFVYLEQRVLRCSMSLIFEGDRTKILSMV